MEVLLGLGLILFLIIVAIKHWEVTLIIICFGFIIHFFHKSNQDEKLRLQQEEYLRKQGIEKEEKERQRIIEHGRFQEQCLHHLKTNCTATMVLYKNSYEYLSKAEWHLDQAEIDLSEDAAYPFWKHIDKALKYLTQFNENILKLQEKLNLHIKLSNSFEGSAPLFPLSTSALDKLNMEIDTNNRMQALYKKAERNNEFIAILQREILQVRIGDVIRSLSDMTSKIESSLDDLSKSIIYKNKEINRYMERVDTKQTHLEDLFDELRRQRYETPKNADK